MTKNLLNECCDYFLEQENNIEGFPQSLFDSKIEKLIHHKLFLLENDNEFKIDNIYVRIFNKEPAHNLDKNIFNLLNQMIDQSIKFLKYYSIDKYINDNFNELSKDEIKNLTKQEIDKNTNLLKSQFTICLTGIFTLKLAVLLLIEQINFNNFNQNPSSSDNKKSIEIITIKKILSLHHLITDNYLLLFDNSIRLVYLQIIYLLTYNENGLTFISSLDFIKLLDKLIEDDSKISDCNIID